MTNNYKIYIYNNESKSYDDYSKFLQLPFNIQECADDRYDTGNFTLRKLDRSIPFEVETKVKVEIHKDNILKNSYVMMIEEDRLETMYIGPRKYYNHNISIIELLKKYDRVFLPDFTITNPGTKTIVQKFEELAADRRVIYSEPGVRELFEFRIKNDVDNFGVFKQRTRNSEDKRTLKVSLDNIPKFTNGIIPVDGYYLNGSWIQLPTPYCKAGDYIGISATATGLLNSNWSSFGVHRSYSSSIGTLEDINIVETADSVHNSNKYKYNITKLRYSLSSDEFSEIDLGYIYINIETGEITNFVANHEAFIKEVEYYDGKEVILRIFIDTSKLNITANTNLNLEINAEYLDLTVADAMGMPSPGGWWTLIDTVATRRMLEENSNEEIFAFQTWFEYYITSLYYMFDRYYNSAGAHLKTERIQQFIDTIKSLAGVTIPPDPNNLIPFVQMYTYLIMSAEHNLYYDCRLEGIRDIDSDKNFPAEEQLHEFLTEKRNRDRNIATLSYNINVGITNPTIILKIQGSDSSYKTVKDLLNKMNTIMKPEDRFILDNTIPDILEEHIPERIYSNRNVSEILFDISSIVSAYPYLDDNNVLTFKRIAPEDNPKYKDKLSNEKITYTSENSINTYMTNISNMISTPDTLRHQYSYWPNSSGYAYANGDWKSSLITPDTNLIEIQNSPGIYFLKYIKVKGCLNTKTDELGNILVGPGTVVDITNYCPEENYYNTLYVKDEGEPSNTNKSNCIYWTKGSNIINLDALEAQEKTAIFGDAAPDNYKIQRAIFYAAKSQLSVGLNTIEDSINPNIEEYRYQICYVNVIDGMIKNKKFNQESENEIISNFNQMDNNLNAIDWLNSAQVNILRRGNTEISKSIMVKDMDLLPLLGEHKFDEAGDILYADDINYNFNNNIVNVDLNYTKNYNKIDPSVALDKEYRQFEIYGREAVNRSIRFDRYIYMETDPTLVPEGKTELTNSKFNLTGHIKQDARNVKPGYMALFFKDSEGNPISYYAMTEGGYVVKRAVQGILVPVNTVASGNNIIIQGELLDNFAAGYHADKTGDPLKYIDIFGNSKESGARRIREARYVDDLGEAEYVNMYLLPEATADVVFNPNIYPNTSLDESAFKNICFDYEEMVPVKKDNREKLNFIYQIHFLTHDNRIKWNPALCKYFFYDQEDKNEMYLDNDGNINSSYLPAYSTAYYDILNDVTVTLTYDNNGKLIIDRNKSEVATYPAIDNNSIGEFTQLISGYTKTLAFIYPKTGEIIYHIDNNAGNLTVPKIYFKIYK